MLLYQNSPSRHDLVSPSRSQTSVSEWPRDKSQGEGALMCRSAIRKSASGKAPLKLLIVPKTSTGREGSVCRRSRFTVRFSFCVGFRMPARRRRNHVHRGRRPEASREGTRGTVGRRECRAHLWGFGRFGSGAGSAPMHPSQRSGGVDAPERGVIAVAELARRCRLMLHPQGAHPFDRAPARPAQDQPW